MYPRLRDLCEDRDIEERRKKGRSPPVLFTQTPFVAQQMCPPKKEIPKASVLAGTGAFGKFLERRWVWEGEDFFSKEVLPLPRSSSPLTKNFVARDHRARR